ncbi:MAG TPA: tryptophan synthase subunit alpha [Bacteroidota bacterium]|nr:tryptophan synthase subunit alpha [Bacteroidota bacterium]
MSRIAGTFRDLKKEGGKALTLFLTSGFPGRESVRSIVPSLVEAGADMIELGMPFSDPLADGPVIQESSTVALRNGTTLKHVLEDVEHIRAGTQVPLLLMGYVNPLLRYGMENFARDAASAGIDGLILPEVPLEETGRFAEELSKNRLDQILLVTPTTPRERIQAIDRASSGFVYCVSTTGVTGRKATVAGGYLASVRSLVVRNPLQVGFGITGPEDARAAAAHADGIIVGSALVRKLRDGIPESQLAAWVRSLKAAVAGVADSRQ